MPIAPAILEKLELRAARHRELTEEISKPEVASDGRRFPELLKERGMLARSAELHESWKSLVAQREGAGLMLADADPDIRRMAEDELAALSKAEDELENEIKGELASDPELERDKVIVEVRAGIGGDEATLFVADMFRMYSRFCDAKRWKLELLEATPSEVGGFKEVIFGLKGEGAWRLFRFESGGHRVQRVPATETQGRIHTSAATVAVLPEVEELEIEIRDEDLRIDTMRAGGPGGQSVNKTSSAVRMTHIPTGTVVICQDEKSQLKNKAKALRIMRARLYEAEAARRHAERAADRKQQVGSGDRSQRIRTYNWPQNRVSDHRLGENFSLEQVVAGRLGPILDALEDQDRELRIKSI